MKYPNLDINIRKLYENAKEIVKRCDDKGIEVIAITKCVSGIAEVAQALVKAGVAGIGDSRIDNLKVMESLPTQKWLIRIPMISEAKDTVLYSDLSLNSEVKTLEALDYWAGIFNKKHKVILMIDFGDLREGWFDLDNFYEDCQKIKELKHIEVVGIGTSSNCAGSIIPEPETFEPFPELINFMKETFNLENPIVSGGTSGTYYMIENGTLPETINNLRFGELILFGREASYFKEYDYLHHDAFQLNAQIIEIKVKPSMPIGKFGKDAFGEEPVFEDLGIRKRAILGIGRQDISPVELRPLDPGAKIITASSDHLIVDITDSENDYQIGDIMSFYCNYVSGLLACTSDYVVKTLIETNLDQ